MCILRGTIGWKNGLCSSEVADERERRFHACLLLARGGGRWGCCLLHGTRGPRIGRGWGRAAHLLQDLSTLGTFSLPLNLRLRTSSTASANLICAHRPLAPAPLTLADLLPPRDWVCCWPAHADVRNPAAPIPPWCETGKNAAAVLTPARKRSRILAMASEMHFMIAMFSFRFTCGLSVSPGEPEK